jgi:hypothetical protein
MRLHRSERLRIELPSTPFEIRLTAAGRRRRDRALLARVALGWLLLGLLALIATADL